MTAVAYRRPPRIVLFRPMPLDRDTRAKKFAATLARGGYEVILLSPVGTYDDTSEQRMGGVRIIPVRVGTRHRDHASRKAIARRQTRLPLLTSADADTYTTKVARRKQALRQNAAQRARLRLTVAPSTAGVGSAARLTTVRVQGTLTQVALEAARRRWIGQQKVKRTVTKGWRAFDQRRRNSTLLATTQGVLPEISDYEDAFGPVLDRLAPDVIHAHHPFILRAAVQAARRSRARGGACALVYDARENFAGIPAGEQGSIRRHSVLVRQEQQTIGEFDRVITVSEPISDELHARYSLTRGPAVVLNVPVRADDSGGATVRDAAGLAADVPLLVYSGGISAARGLETLVEALGMLADVHLAIVAVPFPHPSVPRLIELADTVGAADRIRVLGPVAQQHLASYLSGADIAVHPMPGGSPNHDQALPNKLFEYLHAGLPLVVSDARMMAAFVADHAVGEVFVSGDADSLAEAVARVRRDPPTSEHLADVAGRFSWQGQEPQVLDLYDELTGWASNRSASSPVDLEVRSSEKSGVHG